VLSWGLPVDAVEGTALRFLSAAQVGDFRQVRAVRLCLLLRSSDAVLGPDDVRSYTDCAGNALTSGDGRLRRTFWSTVALRNWSR
jgi:type IV pilus assembly protein PilW